jgi:UDP-N-acetyl-D-galactosamine dehydrogenase
MVQEDIKVKGANILVLGVTFKENCPDVRNTKAVDVINNLSSYGANVTIYDPWAEPSEVMHEYKLKTTNELPNSKFDAVVLTVAHKEFLNLDLPSMLNKKGILYDVKGILEGEVDGRL